MPRVSLAPQFVGGGQIHFKPREVPDPGVGQLLVKVRANAICGSDRDMFYNGSATTPGHEAAGEVAAVGAKTSTELGTRGAIYFKDFCGMCRSCRLGFTSQCLHKRQDLGFNADGGYGPFELVHETNFFPISDDVSFVEATMLLDAMGTTGHAIRRAELLRTDIESIYIAGAGPIGLGLLAMAKIRYGESIPIYIGDVSSWRAELAESMGGLLVKPGSPDIRGGQVDVSFDTTGRAVARQAALEYLGSRGVFVCVGGSEGLVLKDVGSELLRLERSILGSEYFDFSEMPGNLDLLRDNRALIGKLVTHVDDISELQHAFELFLSGMTGKVVVTQTEQPLE